MLSRFHLIPVSYGRTDGQICYINIARHKNHPILTKFGTLQQIVNLMAVT